MINANLGQFLSSGWFNEATLYLDGYTYWCEGYYLNRKEKPFHFVVYRYKSEILKDSNGRIWTKRLIVGNNVVDYSIVFEIDGNDEDDVKQQFLEAKIFNGKSFWDVEKEIAWYDETN